MRVPMKKNILFTFTALILCTIQLSAQTDNRIKIMLTDFTPIYPVTKEQAKTVVELIRQPLINAGTITIVDNLEAPSKGKKKNKTVVEAARALNAAFYIEGSLSGNDSEKILILRVINTFTGEPALQGNFTLVKLDADTQKAGEAIVNTVKGYTDITFDDIKRMSDNEEWDNVLKNISNFMVQYPNKEKVRLEQLRILASRKIGELHYKKSVEFCNNSLFKDANQSIALAISYDPANQTYRQYSNTIKNREKEYIRKNEGLMLQSAKMFIEEGKLKSASDILDRVQSNNPEAIKLRSMVRDELEIISAFERAEKLYDEKKYSLARSAMQLPLKKKPDNIEYQQFISRIEKKEKEQADRLRLMNESISFYKDLTLFSLFVKPKNFKHFESLGYIYSEYTYLDKDNFLKNSADSGKNEVMHGIEATIFWHNDFPFLNSEKKPADGDFSFLKTSWEIFKIKYTFIGSFVLSGNTNETDSTLDGNRSIETTTLFGTRFTGAVGPSVSMYAFLLGGGLDCEMGYLLDSVNNDPLFSGQKANTSNYSYFQAGIGYGLWFAWLPFENTQVFVRWRKISTNLYGSETRSANNSFQHLSIGFGARLF